MSTYGCAQCHETFGSLRAFDEHQDVDFKRPRRQQVICRPPAEAGLVRGNDGRWRIPLSASQACALDNLRAERHSAGMAAGGEIL